eukprot:sb/3462819/
MQPGAFDKAFGFYLNYKIAYANFNEHRTQLNAETVAATETFKNRFNLPEGPPTIPTNTTLKMTVKNLALCLPINRSTTVSPTAAADDLLSASQTDLSKTTNTEGALSISIRTVEMKMAFGAKHANQGHFNHFIVRFIEDFSETRWSENAAPRTTEIEVNSIAVDSGNYWYETMTSSPSVGASGGGKLMIETRSQIEGVNIHVGTNIVTKLVSLYKTLTSIVGADKEVEPCNEQDLMRDLNAQQAEQGQLIDEEGAVAKWKTIVVERAVKSGRSGSTKRKKGLGRQASAGDQAARGSLEEEGREKHEEPKETVETKQEGTESQNLETTHSQDTVETHESQDEEMKQRKFDTVSMFSTRSSATEQQAEEPLHLMFEMDLMVRLGNGKFILYPAAKSTSDHPDMPSLGLSEQKVTNNTEFLIPETTCSLHYTSEKITERTTSSVIGVGSSATSRISTDSEESGAAVTAVKTGSLYSMIKVSSLTQDQILRPCLLDFLDQLLSRNSSSSTIIPEEIGEILKEPRTVVKEEKTSPTPSSEQGSSLKPSPTDTFPVDIAIVLQIEPSTIKLSCHPFSRHECSLLVPRSHFLITTKGTPSQTMLSAATGRKDIVVTRDGSTSCWNMTWCLEKCEFSLYHPLGLLNRQQVRLLGLVKREQGRDC